MLTTMYGKSTSSQATRFSAASLATPSPPEVAAEPEPSPPGAGPGSAYSSSAGPTARRKWRPSTSAASSAKGTSRTRSTSSNSAAYLCAPPPAATTCLTELYTDSRRCSLGPDSGHDSTAGAAGWPSQLRSVSTASASERVGAATKCSVSEVPSSASTSNEREGCVLKHAPKETRSCFSPSRIRRSRTIFASVPPMSTPSVPATSLRA
mmetsp:Transcript_43133/g.139913  ORF Transcript_43133/g.139913 Transcript_43133/m.139913 type:complete len:208 (-) Transcript_43133:67-690(-)